MTVVADDTATAAGTYIEDDDENGVISVTIEPQEAREAGAQWSIDEGTTWHASGDAVSDLAPGDYTVSFSDVTGWVTPPDQTVTVTAGDTATGSGTYIEDDDENGAIRVTIEPQGARNAGAQWSVDGGTTWHTSGDAVSELAPGDYTVSFSDVTGWTTPDVVTVTIAEGEVTNASGTYTVPCDPPAAPTTVLASDGDRANMVFVMWSEVAGATEYEVYRSQSNDSETAELRTTTTATTYEDTSAEAPLITHADPGCFGGVPGNDVEYYYYFYWVKAVNECGSSAFSLSDRGHVGSTEEETKAYEGALPSIAAEGGRLRAQIDSVLSIHLRSDGTIDPSSVWGVVLSSGVRADDVEWLQRDPCAGWVVYRPAEPWYPGDTVTFLAGGNTLTGTTIGPVAYEFQVEDEEARALRASKSRDTVLQPSYTDLDCSGLDLAAESNDEVTVSLVEPNALPSALDGAPGTPFLIGPAEPFAISQRVWLPVPEDVAADSLQLYCYVGVGPASGWHAAEDVADWIVRDSQLLLELNDVTYVGFLVQHGGIVRLARPAPLPVTAKAATVLPTGNILVIGTVLLALVGVGRKTNRRHSGS